MHSRSRTEEAPQKNSEGLCYEKKEYESSVILIGSSFPSVMHKSEDQYDPKAEYGFEFSFISDEY